MTHRTIPVNVVVVMTPRRFLYLVGTLLVSSGLHHLGIFLVDGGPWGGPLSWRKPVTFGISFGVTALAVAWISGFLELGRRVRWLLLGGLGVATGLEVCWVTLQAWRGVPSHFASSGIDEALFIAAGISIALVGVILVAVTVLAFRSPIAPASMALAIRVGLVLLLVGQGLGGAIIANGTAIDRPPTEVDLAILGTAGAMKVPHAVALHAVQVLPLLALVLGSTMLAERRRTQVVGAGALGYGLRGRQHGPDLLRPWSSRALCHGLIARIDRRGHPGGGVRCGDACAHPRRTPKCRTPCLSTSIRSRRSPDVTAAATTRAMAGWLDRLLCRDSARWGSNLSRAPGEIRPRGPHSASKARCRRAMMGGVIAGRGTIRDGVFHRRCACLSALARTSTASSMRLRRRRSSSLPVSAARPSSSSSNAP